MRKFIMALPFVLFLLSATTAHAEEVIQKKPNERKLRGLLMERTADMKGEVEAVLRSNYRFKKGDPTTLIGGTRTNLLADTPNVARTLGVLASKGVVVEVIGIQTPDGLMVRQVIQAQAAPKK